MNKPSEVRCREAKLLLGTMFPVVWGEQEEDWDTVLASGIEHVRLVRFVDRTDYAALYRVLPIAGEPKYYLVAVPAKYYSVPQ